MINLLPYDTKKQTRAARMNIVLVRYFIILIISAAFLSIACIFIYFFLENNKKISADLAKNSVASSSSIQKQAEASQTNLATAKNILDRQVTYSDIITKIAAALPTGTILDSLSLDDSSFGKTTNLKILSKSADNEKKVQENFKNSALFSNYKLQTSTPNQSDSSEYPFTFNISITINKGVSQ